MRAAKTNDAIERIKQLKGRKNKYELVEEKPVYDVVNEDEYADLVVKRQKEDWIVDDAVGGYYEDGREIFDDDADSNEDEETDINESGRKVIKKKKVVRKGKPAEDMEEETASQPKNHSLTVMFKKMSESQPKHKMAKKEIVKDDEELLGNILEDLAPRPLKNTVPSSAGLKLKKLSNVSSPSQLKPKKKDLRAIKRQAEDSIDLDSLENIESFNSAPPSKKSNSLALETDFDHIFDQDIPQKAVVDRKDVDMEGISFPSDYGKNWSLNCTENDDSKPVEKEVEMSSNALDNLVLEETEGSPDKFVRFYWMDACESTGKPGDVYLFGKIFVRNKDEKAGHFTSCCVIVENVQKQLFILPREYRRDDPTCRVHPEKDVKEEFSSMAKKFKISNFRTKPSKKKYAFDCKGVPNETIYLECHVPAVSNIPVDLEGDTFSKIFGSNQSSLERLLIDRKMKGPSWLKLVNPVASSLSHSWSKVELTVNNLKQIVVITEEESQVPPPSFSVMSLSFRTLMNRETKVHEIIGISVCFEKDFNIESGSSNAGTNGKKVGMFREHFFILTKPSSSFGKIFPTEVAPGKGDKLNVGTKVEVKSSEREVLNFFLTQLQKLDPDIIVGHDITDFYLDILLQRLAHHKLPHWSKLGRLRKMNTVPIFKRKERTTATIGRLLADLKISARELIRCKGYDMKELTIDVLKMKDYRELSQDVILNSYDDKDSLESMISFTMMDNQLIYRMVLELNVLPLALQITKIAGNSFSRTLLGGRAERNEFLLLHAFSEENFIVPDKHVYQWNKNKNNKDIKEVTADADEDAVEEDKGVKKKGAQYAGGLVLDPKVGFYSDYVLILDFNSLYPSIMREYNICFTTINLRTFAPEADDEVPKVPDSGCQPGILPTQITRLVESRRQVKKLLNDPSLSEDLKAQYDIKQKALKLTANSMYGCLGFAHSRFYAKALAALITFNGRSILEKTRDLVQELGYDVIYGDTDSIMINTHSKELSDATNISNKVQAQVNSMYKHLEIECDGIFKTMLLLKKKKYAALMIVRNGGEISFKKELKGLDTVRRDWSVIARNVGNEVVDIILCSDKTPDAIVDDIHSKMKQVAEDIRAQPQTKKERISYFSSKVITKQLTRNPQDYPDTKNLSHVLVAVWHNTNRPDKPKVAGDSIKFVICTRKSNEDNFNALPATQRAVDVSRAINDEDFDIDVKYYLEQQIHPVVSRLIEPLEGTDGRSIAEFLGLESSFAPRKAADAIELIVSAGKDRFELCKSLILNCPVVSCGKKIELRQPVDSTKKWVLCKCPHCETSFLEDEKMGRNLVKQVSLSIRRYVDKFYAGWMTCEDASCSTKMRLNAGRIETKGPECPDCFSPMILDFPSSQMHLQLSFFEYILDIKTALRQISGSAQDNNSPPDLNKSLKPTLFSLPSAILERIQEVKKSMSYSVVKLESLFSPQVFSCLRQQK